MMIQCLCLLHTPRIQFQNSDDSMWGASPHMTPCDDCWWLHVRWFTSHDSMWWLPVIHQRWLIKAVPIHHRPWLHVKAKRYVRAAGPREGVGVPFDGPSTLDALKHTDCCRVYYCGSRCSPVGIVWCTKWEFDAYNIPAYAATTCSPVGIVCCALDYLTAAVCDNSTYMLLVDRTWKEEKARKWWSNACACYTLQGSSAKLGAMEEVYSCPSSTYNLAPAGIFV